MTLDRQIDELYQLPLAEFTAARNALAKSLTGADASRVKGLEKPTVVPWAINQLYWRDRTVFDRLMKSGAALRAAQIAALEGKKADVRKAGEAHRQTVAEAVERAAARAAEYGAKPAPDALARMLEALSIAAAPSPHPGRFTDTVGPAGFEALTGVTPQAVPRADAPRRSRSRGERTATGPRRIEIDRDAVRREAERKRAEAEQREKDTRIAAAERTLERARRFAADARRALAEAEDEVRKAERALERARD